VGPVIDVTALRMVENAAVLLQIRAMGQTAPTEFDSFTDEQIAKAMMLAGARALDSIISAVST
jgi:hypothetical protein